MDILELEELIKEDVSYTHGSHCIEHSIFMQGNATYDECSNESIIFLKKHALETAYRCIPHKFNDRLAIAQNYLANLNDTFSTIPDIEGMPFCAIEIEPQQVAEIVHSLALRFIFKALERIEGKIVDETH